MGLEAQRERVRSYAAEKGLKLVDVVTETASGGVQNGPSSPGSTGPRSST
jgi:hypothetical protein